MSDSVGSCVDKLATINQKMFMAQEELYPIRKMTFEEWQSMILTEEGSRKIYDFFQKSMNLNVQRQQLILEVDKKIADMITAAIKGEDLDNGKFIQDQHKTY